ncbi:HupV protein [Exilibacterium tricleocarpae]|uniref:HupV protein n=1 Tax=Exilibacterium tricleocarpae TaxID=2591008 RepID=A0A545TFM5_9GAMM|nr:nickel-dependent hydrogenase large subunit [Exilibacterium tricleocarpae]TQV75976.1 HupV protein [Exilibacterium tricleocarpae]
MSDGGGRKILGPINRVEGDLEVRLEVERRQVTRAWVNSPLFRGFEKILQGKAPADALVYTPRICGICSVSQSIAAAAALAQLQGIAPTENGQLATNLTLACENLADHLSHFYLFFMPDFARAGYADQPWYSQQAPRFRAQTGAAGNQVLPARAAFLQLTGLLAGKWPHSLSLQPGGTSKPLNRSEQLRLQAMIGKFRRFLEQTLFGDQLENVNTLASIKQLQQWQSQHPHSDFGRFLAIADALQLDQLGRAADRFMSYGAYTLRQGWLFRRGCVTLEEGHAVYAKLDERSITEDIASSWLAGERCPLHPYRGRTEPDAEQSGYSWCKAPRLDGRSVEVGALARQVVNGHPLALDLVAQSGASVYSRVIGRLLELALVVPEMENWCAELDPQQPYCRHGVAPDSGRGAGMVEAARGSLGHWLQVEGGRISNYQIIAPTTWNFSPRDGGDQPGALEQALEGAPVAGDIEEALAVQHIIRSFDPCMVCTVH